MLEKWTCVFFFKLNMSVSELIWRGPNDEEEHVGLNHLRATALESDARCFSSLPPLPSVNAGHGMSFF